jgi:hypothetical protein
VENVETVVIETEVPTPQFEETELQITESTTETLQEEESIPEGFQQLTRQTPEPTEVVEEPEIIPGTTTYTVRIESEFMNGWWESFVRDIDVIVPECAPSCSMEQIEEALGPPFEKDNWTAVKVQNVYYVHSGWDLLYGPEFGDFLKRLEKSDKEFTIWFDNNGKKKKDGKVLEATASISLSELFQTDPTDEFFITCWDGYIGKLTPKLIIQFSVT